MDANGTDHDAIVGLIFGLTEMDREKTKVGFLLLKNIVKKTERRFFNTNNTNNTNRIDPK